MHLNKTQWFLIIICAVLIIPVLCFAFYSIPAADDFANAVCQKQLAEEYGNLFTAAVAEMRNSYLTIGGYWSALFLNCYFQPYLRWGLMGLRTFNACALGFLFFSVFCLCRTFIRTNFKAEKTETLAFFAAAIYCINNNYMNSELYTWYTVLAAYIIPLSIMMLGIAFFMKLREDGKPRWAVLACICGFIANGSSLNVAMLCCGMYFIIAYYYTKYDKPNRKKAIIAAAVSYIGAVINVIAPGNFARRGSFVTDYGVVSALKDSAIRVASRLFHLVARTPFFALLILFFIFLAPKFSPKNRTKISFSHPFAIAVLCYAGATLVTFTVLFGYSGDSYFPDRCIFILDLAIYILSGLFLLYLAGYCEQKKLLPKFTDQGKLITLCVCILFGLLQLNIQGPINITTPNMVISMMNGSAREYAELHEGIIDEIAASPSKDVTVTRDHRLASPLIMEPYIDSDAAWWVNKRVSQYFGKNSVRLIYLSEQE